MFHFTGVYKSKHFEHETLVVIRHVQIRGVRNWNQLGQVWIIPGRTPEWRANCVHTLNELFCVFILSIKLIEIAVLLFHFEQTWNKYK